MKLLERPADPVLDYFKVALLPYCTDAEASEASHTVRETLKVCGTSNSWSDEMEVFMLGRMVYLFGGEAGMRSFFAQQTIRQSDIPFLRRLIIGKISAIDGHRLIESRVLTYQNSTLNAAGGVWTLHLDKAIAEASGAFELGYIQILKRIFSSLATLTKGDVGRDVVKIEGLESLSPAVALEVKQTLPGLLKECFSLQEAKSAGLIWAI